MARKKAIRISLAAKCQLLFGLAVLVIIAGALAVPWQRMEQLAVQPNVKAARLAADMYFRQVHALAFSGATRPSVAGSTAAATAPGASRTVRVPTTQRWNEVALTDADFPPPRIYRAPSPTGDFPASVKDPVAREALKIFRTQPGETEYGKVVTVSDRAGERERMYRFAAPITLDASCIACHAEYASWWKPGAGMLPPGAAAASMPAKMRTAAGLKRAPSPGAPTATAISNGATADAPPVVGVVRVDVPYQTDENQLLLNRIVIVVAGMLGGTLAIVVFYLITSRLILQPVRVLKNTAEKVAKGDLNIRSAISTGDEFQHLSETFNSMLGTLKASQDQLEATNRSLDTRVGELARSNVDLFEASRLKSEFLTNVTHELRTPLNAIIGFADLMADTAARGADPKLQRYAENIRLSARQLLDLINDLLDLAKIEAGKLVLREERVNVADVCEAMANFMRPLAQKKNIDLQMSVAPDMPLITTDPGRLQQILYNFLSNAIKFTPAEGQVEITARNEPPELELPDKDAAHHPDAASAPPAFVRVSITDTGPGISAEDQRVMFEKFRQLDGSVTRQHTGTGLGLTIARELAAMLGARIDVASTRGKGATFSLIMPLENPRHTLTAPA